MSRALAALALLSIAGMATAQTAPVLRSSWSAAPPMARIDWTTVPGVTYYQVRRTYTFPAGWVTYPPTTSNVYGEWFDHTKPNQIVFQVIPCDANGNPVGLPSNYAWVTKHPYAAAITAGQTPVVPSHITELRSIVTSVRASLGLGPPIWTQPTLTPGETWIKGADIQDLRDAVDGMTSHLGLPPPPYAQASPMEGKFIRKVDVQQLRDVLRSYPEMYWGSATAIDPYFSPNGDGVKDTTTFRSDVAWNHGSSRTDFRWQIIIRNSANAIIRTDSGSSVVTPATATDHPRVIHNWVWDGRNGSGMIQPDGVYTYEIVDLDTISGPTPFAYNRTTATIDTVPPTATISAPADPYTLSNVRLDGGGSVTVTGTVSDALSFDSWKLERTGNGEPAVQLGNGTAAVSNGTLGTLSTITGNAPAIPNGGYQLELTATDKAGNSTVETNTVNVAHFSPSQNVYQIKAVDNQTVTYTSSVPFALTQTIEIRNAANNVVRTLFSGARAAGSYQNSWDGRNDAGQVVADGPHYMVSTLTEGSSSMTWDPRTSYVGGQPVTQYEYPQCLSSAGGWVSCSDSAAIDFDPFQLKPLTLSYCVGGGTVTNCSASSMPAWVIAKVTNVAETDATCNPACIFTEYQPGGPQKFPWFGTSTGGSYVAPQYLRLTVIRRFDQIPKNFVLVYGTKPSISNPRITPLFFNPGAGTTANGAQTFTVNVDTYNGRHAQLRLQFRNMVTNSTLRTILTPLSAEGDISATWDGRAANNAPVAPGWYQVTITAIDSAGSATDIKPIVVVRY